MRELTVDECSYVSGGVPHDIGDVIVTGDPSDYHAILRWLERISFESAGYYGNGQPVGGDHTGEPSQSLGPDLSVYNCAMLAIQEERARETYEGARSISVPLLSAGHQQDGWGLFNEYMAAFQSLEDRGLWNPNNPAENIARVYAETDNAQNQLSVFLRSIGVGLAVDYAALELVQTAFAAVQRIERIDAEQARRGCQS